MRSPFHTGATNLGTFTTDDLVEGTTNLYSQWERENSFLRPKLATDGLYIGAAATPTSPFSGELAVFEGNSEAFFTEIANGNGSASGAYFIGVPTGGTQGTPSATLADSFAKFVMAGYGDSAFNSNSLAGLSITATGTWTDTTQPSTVALGDVATGNIFAITLGSGTGSDGDSFLNTTGGQIMHSDFSADRLYFGDADEAYFDDNGLLYLPDGSASAPSLTNNGDANTGLYFPAADQLGITTEGTSTAIFANPTTATGSFLELAPSNRTLGASISAIQNFINVDSTYTLNATNAVAPIGYNFSVTNIFSTNGYGLGSGFLFWNHMLVQNDSGSTRSIGPLAGYVGQTSYQANGGTFTVLAGTEFIAQPSYTVINSGTLSVTLAANQFWSNGATIGSGVTIPNYNHFIASNITNSGTVTYQAGMSIGSLTAATNNSAIVIGTQTTGNWGIYQSTTTDNYLGGELGLGVAPTAKLHFAEATTAAGGIAFGSDTNLYRSAANVLTTDDGIDAALDVRARQTIMDGDNAGVASTNSITGVTDTPTTDPGWATSDTVAMNAPNGYIKAYVGTQAVVIPYWNT